MKLLLLELDTNGTIPFFVFENSTNRLVFSVVLQARRELIINFFFKRSDSAATEIKGRKNYAELTSSYPSASDRSLLLLVKSPTSVFVYVCATLYQTA